MGKRANKRRNALLCLLLALQVGLIVYMFSLFRGTEDPVVTGDPLLKNFITEAVTSITITGENAESITLTKQAGAWEIRPPGMPANAGKIEDLLDKLAGLKRNRLVTRTSASHNRLKVGQVFMRHLVLNADPEDATILFGSSPNYKTMHIRLQGEDEVYLAQDLSAWEAPLEKEAWWDTNYVKVDPAALSAVELHNDHGSVTLRKDAAGAWQLGEKAADQELDAEALDLFLADMSSCTILTYLDNPARPAEMTPVITLELTTEEGTITLEVGPKDEETNEHIVKSNGSPFFATASIHAVKEFLERRAADLIQTATPPTPPAEPAD